MTDSDHTEAAGPLSRFRARLAQPRAWKRLDALLSMPDPEAAVTSLSITELYFLIKEVGLGDSVDLLALASPDQFQGCLDLEVWDRDQVQLEAVLPWLVAIQEVGFEKLGQMWNGLDPELAALTLARHTRIYDHSLDEEAPEDSELPRFDTPDSFFTIELATERDEDGRMIHALIEDLYRFDLGVARHALMSARSELQTELEEMSYRWRSGRLADLGYADFYEALEVFRPLDLASVTIGEGTAERPVQGAEEAPRGPGDLPVPMLEQVLGRAFLARALSAIGDTDETSRLESALVILVNKVLAAARISPGDEEAVVIGTEHATATLALGLEAVSRGDIEVARAALTSVSLTRLHRVGYTISLQLARAARTLRHRATTAGEPATTTLAALARSRPFYPQLLDDPPGNAVRPFESLRDIARVAELLRLLATRISVAGALGVDLIAMGEIEPPRPDLDDHARTAIARVLLGGELEARPLGSGEVRAVAAVVAEPIADDQLASIARALLALTSVDEVVIDAAALASLVRTWTGDLADELAPLADAAGDIDPRFVGSVLLRSSMD